MQTIAFDQWQSLNGNHIGIVTLEDLSSAYISAEQDESAALFKKGEVMLQAVYNNVASKQDVIRHCAHLSRRTKRAVLNYYRTAEIFPENRRNPELGWSLHMLCASTDNPHGWLDFASQEYVDENGELQQHSYRTLKEAIQASGGDTGKAKLHYLIEGANAFMRVGAGGHIAIRLDGDYALPSGINVKVWIAIETEQSSGLRTESAFHSQENE